MELIELIEIIEVLKQAVINIIKNQNTPFFVIFGIIIFIIIQIGYLMYKIKEFIKEFNNNIFMLKTYTDDIKGSIQIHENTNNMMINKIDEYDDLFEAYQNQINNNITSNYELFNGDIQNLKNNINSFENILSEIKNKLET